MTAPRLLEDCPAVIYIVYTPGAHAEAGGYEPWLAKIDNPFFNAIPGVHHYANWKMERVLNGTPTYQYFDFQGLAGESDLERVWFSADLDRFRTEWVRLWGYAGGKPDPVQGNAYLMRPVRKSSAAPARFALVTGGVGDAPPSGTGLAWRIEETIRKHFAIGPISGAWRVPAATDNPLGLDWLAVRYGDSVDDLAASYRPGTESVAFVARLLAAPES
jgi:hypothetical protein